MTSRKEMSLRRRKQFCVGVDCRQLHRGSSPSASLVCSVVRAAAWRPQSGHRPDGFPGDSDRRPLDEPRRWFL
ncbi:unnamed protein product [Protopolystoma xenopodis]|uniref:Uncharacterized protein n=1 Tax=Protopolystoma xenopodis TaxID=117903 RepID=A0A3S5CGM2_9PLAT|nr:unnamed protein product [Protopolystoma xenopodis]